MKSIVIQKQLLGSHN